MKFFNKIFNPSNTKPQYLRGMDFPASDVIKNPLLHVRLFHGNLCNLRCEYCFTAAPTLEPDFDDLVRGIRDLKMIPVIVTNGTTFSKKWEFLHDMGASVMLKMNSFDADKEASLFGISKTSEIFKNIKTATDANSQGFKAFAQDRRLAINCVLSSQTIDEDDAPAVLRYCRENGAIPWIDKIIHDGRADYSFDLPEHKMEVVVGDLVWMDSKYGYKHKISDSLNFGAEPEMNRNFFQITEHGRMSFVHKFGTADDCDERIDNGCTECRLIQMYIKNNIVSKLNKYGINVRMRY
jgi:MoaA/NifB/PqqE/SkfB family radical SAM enzyme